MKLMNMRRAYGDTLVALGGSNPGVVALEADLGRSTMSMFFGEKYPERYFQLGIAEANMMSVAAGLALTGHTAFVSTFAVFATGRAYDQLRSSVVIPRLNVKVCGSSAGLSDFGDGKTHQSVDDIALMRVLPGMTVFSPADAVEAALFSRARADIPGPCYLRLNRNDLPVLTREDEPFTPGKVRLMRDGHDVVVYATGYMVYLALEAAKLLEARGLSLKVVNVHTIKPLDGEGIRAHARGMKGALTVEEASVIGGLGSAVCEALMSGPADSRVRVTRLGMQDVFGTSAADYHELLAAYDLTADHIAAQARQVMDA